MATGGVITGAARDRERAKAAEPAAAPSRERPGRPIGMQALSAMAVAESVRSDH
jgi:hypothetical protein